MKTIHDYIKGLLTIEQANKLTTKRLLAYYKKKRWLWWICCCECCGELLTQEDAVINGMARSYRDEIKKILDTRENVD